MKREMKKKFWFKVFFDPIVGILLLQHLPKGCKLIGILFLPAKSGP